MTLAMMWCSRVACSVPALVGALCCFAAVSAAAQTRDDFEYWDTNGNGDLTCSEALRVLIEIMCSTSKARHGALWWTV